MHCDRPNTPSPSPPPMVCGGAQHHTQKSIYLNSIRCVTLANYHVDICNGMFPMDFHRQPTPRPLSLSLYLFIHWLQISTDIFFNIFFFQLFFIGFTHLVPNDAASIVKWATKIRTSLCYFFFDLFPIHTVRYRITTVKYYNCYCLLFPCHSSVRTKHQFFFHCL